MVQASEGVEVELKAKIEGLIVDQRQKAEKAAHELKQTHSQIKELNKEISILKDSTKVGEKERELEKVRQDHKENLELMHAMRVETEAAREDRAQLAQRLIETEAAADQRVADRVVAEREQSRKLQQDLLSLEKRFHAETDKLHALEDEKQILVREIDDLTYWKSIYESGHGLQELARNQKKLKDDCRRLGVAVEQGLSKLGEAMDANSILYQAFQRLKKDTKADPNFMTKRDLNFMYSEYELQEELTSDNARLKAQTAVQEEQIHALEIENINLRKTIQNQAGSIGT